MLKIVLLFLSFTLANAYEIPSIDLSKDTKPKIIIFNATSIVVDDHPFYVIKWETINSNLVQATFVGKIAPSGTITITKDEYNRGPITLTASDTNSSFSDSKTINKSRDKDVEQVVFEKPHERDNNFYNTTPYMRTPARRPLRRRYY